VRCRTAGVDSDNIGAELGELRQHEAVNTFADGRKQHNRSNANGNAEQGEEAAHAVGNQGASGQGYKVAE